MTPEQTDVRSREIALAKYIDYDVRRRVRMRDSTWTGWIGGKPLGRSFIDEGSKFSKDAAFERLAPRFATDESLLSTLMKGLAGKGHGPKVVGYTDTYWEARLIDPRNFERSEFEAEAESSIAALFEAACQLPQVQQLIEEVTP